MKNPKTKRKKVYKKVVPLPNLNALNLSTSDVGTADISWTIYQKYEKSLKPPMKLSPAMKVESFSCAECVM